MRDPSEQFGVLEIDADVAVVGGGGVEDFRSEETADESRSGAVPRREMVEARNDPDAGRCEPFHKTGQNPSLQIQARPQRRKDGVGEGVLVVDGHPRNAILASPTCQEGFEVGDDKIWLVGPGFQVESGRHGTVDSEQLGRVRQIGFHRLGQRDLAPVPMEAQRWDFDHAGVAADDPERFASSENPHGTASASQGRRQTRGAAGVASAFALDPVPDTR